MKLPTLSALNAVLGTLLVASTSCGYESASFQEQKIDEASELCKGSIQGLRSESIALRINADDASTPLIFSDKINEYGDEISYSPPIVDDEVLTLTTLLDWIERELGTVQSSSSLHAHELTHILQQGASGAARGKQSRPSLDSDSVKFLLTDLSLELGKLRCFTNESSAKISSPDSLEADRKTFACSVPDDLLSVELAAKVIVRGWDVKTAAPKKSFGQKLGGVAKGVAQVGLGVAGAKFSQSTIDLANQISAALEPHLKDFDGLAAYERIALAYEEQLVRRAAIPRHGLPQLLRTRNDSDTVTDAEIISATQATFAAIETIRAELAKGLEGCDAGESLEDCFMRATLAKLTIPPEHKFETELSKVDALLVTIRATDGVSQELLDAATALERAATEFKTERTAYFGQIARENTMFSSISNVLKTKHDTVKNSVGNIR